MTNVQREYKGACFCGAVEVTVVGPPMVAGYCHCHSCRKWHAAPVNAWSAWSNDNVTITGETLPTEQAGKCKRICCTACGGGVANEIPAFGMIVVYPMTLAGSGFQFEPRMHIFYEERVMDLHDGLPKFIDVPKYQGGSGKMINEDGHTGWRASGG